MATPSSGDISARLIVETQTTGQAELRSLRGEVNGLVSDAGAYSAELSDLAGRAKTLTAEEAALAAALREQRNAQAAAQAEEKALTAERDKAERAAAALATRAAELEEKWRSQTGALRTYSQELRDQQTALGTLATAVAAAKQDLESLRQVESAMPTKEGAAAVREAESAYRSLAAQYERLQTQTSDTAAAMDRQREAIAKTREAQDAAATQAQELAARQQALGQRLDETRAAAASASEAVARSTAAYQGLADEARRAQAEAQRLGQELAGASTQADETAAAGRRAGTGLRDVGDGSEAARAGAGNLRQELVALGQDLAGLVLAAKLKDFVASSVEATRQAEQSFRGLESVSKAAGVSIADSFGAASRLAADGLMTVSDASKGLQNLLSSGFSLDQAVATLDRLKDSAVNNRQAQYGLSEAVLATTEGIRTNSSEMADAAGVTENLGQMFDRYAGQVGKTAASLTEAERAEAVYQGVLRGTAAFVGDAEKASGSLDGTLSQLTASTNALQVAFGSSLLPAVQGLASAGTSLLNDWVRPFLGGLEILGVKTGEYATKVGILWDVLTGQANPAGVFERLAEAERLADEMAGEIVKRWEGGLIPAAQAVTAATEAQAQAARDAAAAQAAAVEAAKSAYDKLPPAIQEGIAKIASATDRSGELAKALGEAAAAGQNFGTAQGVALLGQTLEAARTKAALTASEIRDGVGQSLADLSGGQLQAFQAAATSSFDAGTLAATDLQVYLAGSLDAALGKLGVSLAGVSDHATAAGRETVAAFEAVATNSEATGRQVQAAFRAALAGLENPAELAALEGALQAAWQSGVLSAGDYQRALREIQDRTREVTAELSPLQAAFEKLGIQSQASLEAAAVAAKTAYDEISAARRGGEATLQDERRAYESYAEAQRAALEYANPATRELGEAMLASKAAVLGLDTAGQVLHGTLGGLSTRAGEAGAALRSAFSGDYGNGPQIAARQAAEAVSLMNQRLTETGTVTGQMDLYRKQVQEFGAAAEAEFNRVALALQRNVESFQKWFQVTNTAVERVKKAYQDDADAAEQYLERIDRVTERLAAGLVQPNAGLDAFIRNTENAIEGLDRLDSVTTAQLVAQLEELRKAAAAAAKEIDEDA